MQCPYCLKPINPASMLGSIKTEKKSNASRENGKLGGRPSDPRPLSLRRALAYQRKKAMKHLASCSLCNGESEPNQCPECVQRAVLKNEYMRDAQADK